MSEDVRQGGQNELQFRIVAVEVLSCEEGETVLCEHQVIQPWLVFAKLCRCLHGLSEVFLCW